MAGLARLLGAAAWTGCVREATIERKTEKCYLEIVHVAIKLGTRPEDGSAPGMFQLARRQLSPYSR